MINLLNIEINNINGSASATSMADGVHTRCICNVLPKDRFFTLQQEDVNEKECQEISQFIINENVQCFFYSGYYFNNNIVANSSSKVLMQKQ